MKIVLVLAGLLLTGCAPAGKPGLFTPTGSFGAPVAVSWHTSIEHNKASGVSRCSIEATADLAAAYFRTAAGYTFWGLMVGYDHHPSFSRYVNVDGQRFVGDHDGFGDATPIIQAMRRGQTIAYEWYKWPSGPTRQGELYLSGFDSAAAYCESAI